jgi:hypothetical protein
VLDQQFSNDVIEAQATVLTAARISAHVSAMALASLAAAGTWSGAHHSDFSAEDKAEQDAFDAYQLVCDSDDAGQLRSLPPEHNEIDIDNESDYIASPSGSPDPGPSINPASCMAETTLSPPKTNWDKTPG